MKYSMKPALTGEEQYLALAQRIIDHGTWVMNERTGKRCLTVLNADFEYDASGGKIPLLTTRRMDPHWKSAIAEMVGYLRGYDNAAQFEAIGCRTWRANADKTPAWLANPRRKGDGDIGRAYGVQLRDWQGPDGRKVDQLANAIEQLKKGDNRRVIMTFHNPGELDLAALDACMHTHTFSILGETLYLTSYQRSADVPLGVAFNMVQTVFLLRVMAQLTGLKAGRVFHKMINCHVYEDQLELMKTQIGRKLYDPPELYINPRLKTLEQLENDFHPQSPGWVSLHKYTCHPAIAYPFSE